MNEIIAQVEATLEDDRQIVEAGMSAYEKVLARCRTLEEAVKDSINALRDRDAKIELQAMRLMDEGRAREKAEWERDQAVKDKSEMLAMFSSIRAQMECFHVPLIDVPRGNGNGKKKKIKEPEELIGNLGEVVAAEQT